MFGAPILQLQENASAARWQTSINVSISSFFIFCLRLKIMKFRMTFYISYFYGIFLVLFYTSILLLPVFFGTQANNSKF